MLYALDHLKNDHHFESQELSFNEKHVNEINFNIEKFKKNMWITINEASTIFEVDGKTFIHFMHVNDDFVSNGNVIQWIRIIGSPKEAENYAYTLEYFGKDGRTSTYIGQVTSIETMV